ncbi:MAG TPA: hypothetical protein VFV42_10055 [Acidimicrobiales bacterium]|nr:hypothetical protein [Acidimicrobiales bacterium]
MRRRFAVALAAALLLAGCGDDDGDAVPPADPLPEADELPTHGSAEPETGGIEVPRVPGTFPAPFPSLGFGLAVPQGWNATRLGEEDLERLADAELAEPFFLEAARTVAGTGAVFYAAGIDDGGRVAEIKVDLQEGTDVAAARREAEAAVTGAGATDLRVVEAGDGRVRLDFRLRQPSADDGTPIDAYLSQLLVPGDGGVWSIIVTSEDESTQSAVLAIVDAGFVVA